MDKSFSQLEKARKQPKTLEVALSETTTRLLIEESQAQANMAFRARYSMTERERLHLQETIKVPVVNGSKPHTGHAVMANIREYFYTKYSARRDYIDIGGNLRWALENLRTGKYAHVCLAPQSDAKDAHRIQTFLQSNAVRTDLESALMCDDLQHILAGLNPVNNTVCAAGAECCPETSTNLIAFCPGVTMRQMAEAMHVKEATSCHVAMQIPSQVLRFRKWKFKEEKLQFFRDGNKVVFHITNEVSTPYVHDYDALVEWLTVDEIRHRGNRYRVEVVEDWGVHKVFHLARVNGEQKRSPYKKVVNYPEDYTAVYDFTKGPPPLVLTWDHVILVPNHIYNPLIGFYRARERSDRAADLLASKFAALVQENEVGGTTIQRGWTNRDVSKDWAVLLAVFLDGLHTGFVKTQMASQFIKAMKLDQKLHQDKTVANLLEWLGGAVTRKMVRLRTEFVDRMLGGAKRIGLSETTDILEMHTLFPPFDLLCVESEPIKTGALSLLPDEEPAMKWFQTRIREDKSKDGCIPVAKNAYEMLLNKKDSEVDARRLSFLCGVPGSGKTTKALSLVGNKIKVVGGVAVLAADGEAKCTVIIVPTRDLQLELRDKIDHLGLICKIHVLTTHKAILQLQKAGSCDQIIVDEAFLYPMGYLLALTAYGRVLALGDPKQISYIDFDSEHFGDTPEFAKPSKHYTRYSHAWLKTSHSMPKDVSNLLKCYDGLTTSSTVSTSLYELRPSSLHEKKNLPMLTFTQDDKTKLAERGFQASTVHESQGKRIEEGVLYIGSGVPEKWLNPKLTEGHVVVALTRHTKALYICDEKESWYRKLAILGTGVVNLLETGAGVSVEGLSYTEELRPETITDIDAGAKVTFEEGNRLSINPTDIEEAFAKHYPVDLHGIGRVEHLPDCLPVQAVISDLGLAKDAEPCETAFAILETPRLLQQESLAVDQALKAAADRYTKTSCTGRRVEENASKLVEGFKFWLQLGDAGTLETEPEDIARAVELTVRKIQERGKVDLTIRDVELSEVVESLTSRFVKNFLKKQTKVKPVVCVNTSTKAGQLINQWSKDSNVVFSVIVKTLEIAVRRALDDRVIMANGWTEEQVKDHFERFADPNHMAYMGDASQFDGSQDKVTDRFITHLMSECGLNTTAVKAYEDKKRVRTSTNTLHRWSFVLYDGKDSGEPGTWLTNTMITMAHCGLKQLEGQQCYSVAQFSGDDSCIKTPYYEHPEYDAWLKSCSTLQWKPVWSDIYSHFCHVYYYHVDKADGSYEVQHGPDLIGLATKICSKRFKTFDLCREYHNAVKDILRKFEITELNPCLVYVNSKHYEEEHQFAYDPDFALFCHEFVLQYANTRFPVVFFSVYRSLTTHKVTRADRAEQPESWHRPGVYLIEKETAALCAGRAAVDDLTPEEVVAESEELLQVAPSGRKFDAIAKFTELVATLKKGGCFEMVERDIKEDEEEPELTVADLGAHSGILTKILALHCQRVHSFFHSKYKGPALGNNVHVYEDFDLMSVETAIGEIDPYFHVVISDVAIEEAHTSTGMLTDVAFMSAAINFARLYGDENTLVVVKSRALLNEDLWTDNLESDYIYAIRLENSGPLNLEHFYVFSNRALDLGQNLATPEAKKEHADAARRHRLTELRQATQGMTKLVEVTGSADCEESSCNEKGEPCGFCGRVRHPQHGGFCLQCGCDQGNIKRADKAFRDYDIRYEEPDDGVDDQTPGIVDWLKQRWILVQSKVEEVMNKSVSENLVALSDAISWSLAFFARRLSRSTGIAESICGAFMEEVMRHLPLPLARKFIVLAHILRAHAALHKDEIDAAGRNRTTRVVENLTAAFVANEYDRAGKWTASLFHMVHNWASTKVTNKTLTAWNYCVIIARVCKIYLNRRVPTGAQKIIVEHFGNEEIGKLFSKGVKSTPIVADIGSTVVERLEPLPAIDLRSMLLRTYKDHSKDYVKALTQQLQSTANQMTDWARGVAGLTNIHTIDKPTISGLIRSICQSWVCLIGNSTMILNERICSLTKVLPNNIYTHLTILTPFTEEVLGSVLPRVAGMHPVGFSHLLAGALIATDGQSGAVYRALPQVIGAWVMITAQENGFWTRYFNHVNFNCSSSFGHAGLANFYAYGLIAPLVQLFGPWNNNWKGEFTRKRLVLNRLFGIANLAYVLRIISNNFKGMRGTLTAFDQLEPDGEAVDAIHKTQIEKTNLVYEIMAGKNGRGRGANRNPGPRNRNLANQIAASVASTLRSRRGGARAGSRRSGNGGAGRTVTAGNTSMAGGITQRYSHYLGMMTKTTQVADMNPGSTWFSACLPMATHGKMYDEYVHTKISVTYESHIKGSTAVQGRGGIWIVTDLNEVETTDEAVIRNRGGMTFNIQENRTFDLTSMIRRPMQNTYRCSSSNTDGATQFWVKFGVISSTGDPPQAGVGAVTINGLCHFYRRLGSIPAAPKTQDHVYEGWVEKTDLSLTSLAKTFAARSDARRVILSDTNTEILLCVVMEHFNDDGKIRVVRRPYAVGNTEQDIAWFYSELVRPEVGKFIIAESNSQAGMRYGEGFQGFEIQTVIHGAEITVVTPSGTFPVIWGPFDKPRMWELRMHFDAVNGDIDFTTTAKPTAFDNRFVCWYSGPLQRVPAEAILVKNSMGAGELLRVQLASKEGENDDDPQGLTNWEDFKQPLQSILESSKETADNTSAIGSKIEAVTDHGLAGGASLKVSNGPLNAMYIKNTVDNPIYILGVRTEGSSDSKVYRYQEDLRRDLEEKYGATASGDVSLSFRPIMYYRTVEDLKKMESTRTVKAVYEAGTSMADIANALCMGCLTADYLPTPDLWLDTKTILLSDSGRTVNFSEFGFDYTGLVDENGYVRRAFAEKLDFFEAWTGQIDEQNLSPTGTYRLTQRSFFSNQDWFGADAVKGLGGYQTYAVGDTHRVDRDHRRHLWPNPDMKWNDGTALVARREIRLVAESEMLMSKYGAWAFEIADDAVSINGALTTKEPYSEIAGFIPVDLSKFKPCCPVDVVPPWKTTIIDCRTDVQYGVIRLIQAIAWFACVQWYNQHKRANEDVINVSKNDVKMVGERLRVASRAERQVLRNFFDNSARYGLKMQDALCSALGCQSAELSPFCFVFDLSQDKELRTLDVDGALDHIQVWKIGASIRSKPYKFCNASETGHPMTECEYQGEIENFKYDDSLYPMLGVSHAQIQAFVETGYISKTLKETLDQKLWVSVKDYKSWQERCLDKIRAEQHN